MKKVLCIMSDGFEELEAVGTIALLRRAGICIDVYSLHGTQATGRFDLTISNIEDMKKADTGAYDALFIPGGPHYATLEKNQDVKDIIMKFVQADKVVSAICAAPTILGRMGLLKNKHYTCFTSMNEDFGGTYVDAYVAVDEPFVTGRSAAAVIDFAFALIEKLEGKEKADAVKKEIYY